MLTEDIYKFFLGLSGATLSDCKLFKFIYLFKQKYVGHYIQESLPLPLPAIPASSYSHAQQIASELTPKHYRLIKYMSPIPYYTLKCWYNYLDVYYVRPMVRFLDCYYANNNIFNLSFAGITPHLALILRRFIHLKSQFSLDLNGFFDNIFFDHQRCNLREFLILTHTPGSKSYTEQGIFSSSFLNTYVHCHILLQALNDLPAAERVRIAIVLYVDNVFILADNDELLHKFLELYKLILKRYNLTYDVDSKVFCTLVSLNVRPGDYNNDASKFCY